MLIRNQGRGENPKELETASKAYLDTFFTVFHYK